MLARLFFALLPFLLVLGLVGCGPTEKPAAVETPAAPPAKPAPPPVPGPDLTSLADSNVAEKLQLYLKQHPASEVVLHTRHGDMRIRLYDDTPIHKANFLLLSRKGVFDETVFNRVVDSFAIQGGRSDHRTIRIARYRLPAEIRPHHFHKRGALGMARYDDDKNPERRSTSTDFYLVQGQRYEPYQSRAVAGRKLTPEQVRVYAKQGGVPSLDGQYTVFGEVVEGLEVIDKIAAEPVDADKYPKKDIDIKMEVK